MINFLEDRVMNLYSESGSSARFYAVSLVIAAILFCASISPVLGQERSEDRDKPTLLNSNEINDNLDGSGDQYFYKFSAGPGKLTVTFEVKAVATNAGATLDLFDNKSRPLLSDVLAQGVDGGAERVVNSVQISTKQDVVLRIKGIRYGDSGGTGTYKVALSGAVNITPAAAPAGGAAAPAAGGAAAPGPKDPLTGELDGTERTTSFHKLNVTGPGNVTFNFSVKPIDKNAQAAFAVLDSNSKMLLQDISVQGTDSVSRSLTFDKPQLIIILVKGVKNGDSVGKGTYTVQFSGPIEVGR
jgi:hypothetical protein